MELLRFFTAGNVDDGKSTLIGRLLYDSHSISTDIIETLTKQSKSKGVDADIDLALLTDGLRAEREQGITIDVAYKYFTTDKRKYIIADTPGHAQYTRNMFTGASNTDLAIILVDARHGVTEQTKRHSIIASILGIPQVVLCVNKMDLIDYNEAKYQAICEEYKKFTSKLNLQNISYIPASAITGENVVNKSDNLSWYEGPTLFSFLEEVEIPQNEAKQEARFQVQYVIRPQSTELHDYRGYAGSVLSGNFKKGQAVQILPHEISTTITKIEHNGNEVEQASSGQPVILHVEDDIDISRGTSIVPLNEQPQIDKNFDGLICWMDNKSYQEGQKLILQQNSFTSKVLIKDIQSKLNIHNFNDEEFDGRIGLNDFCKISFKTAEFISFDSYKTNRKTGAFILINENTKNTVAAGVIL